MIIDEAQRREGCVRSGRLRFLKNIENFQFTTITGGDLIIMLESRP